jgi:hypothetical protein
MARSAKRRVAMERRYPRRLAKSHPWFAGLFLGLVVFALVLVATVVASKLNGKQYALDETVFFALGVSSFAFLAVGITYSLPRNRR